MLAVGVIGLVLTTASWFRRSAVGVYVGLLMTVAAYWWRIQEIESWITH